MFRYLVSLLFLSTSLVAYDGCPICLIKSSKCMEGSHGYPEGLFFEEVLLIFFDQDSGFSGAVPLLVGISDDYDGFVIGYESFMEAILGIVPYDCKYVDDILDSVNIYSRDHPTVISVMDVHKHSAKCFDISIFAYKGVQSSIVVKIQQNAKMNHAKHAKSDVTELDISQDIID